MARPTAQFRPSARPAQRHGLQGRIPGAKAQFHLHAIPRGAELPVFLHLMMENKSSRNGAENAMKKLLILMAVVVMSISAIGCNSCPCGWGCRRPAQPAPVYVTPCETPCESPCGCAMRRLPDLPLRPAALPEASFLHCVGRDGPCRPGGCAGSDGLDAVVQLAVARSSSVVECRAAVHEGQFPGNRCMAIEGAAFTSTISPAWIGCAFSANPSARPLSRRACRTS